MAIYVELDENQWTATAGAEEVLYTELVRDGSPSFTIENDGTTLSRHLLIQWQDLDDAKLAFLGYPVLLNLTGPGQSGPYAGAYISRSTPDAFYGLSSSNSKPYLYATKFSGQGYGMPDDAAEGGIHDVLSDSPVYRYAKLEVTYETLTYDVLSDQQMIEQGLVDANGNPDEATLARYVTKEFNPGSEYLTLPQGGFKFVGPTTGSPPTPVPVPGGPGKIVPNYDISLTWHQVPLGAVGSILLNPTLQNPSIDQCLGNVNNSPFPAKLPGGSPGWPAGALLMTGATIKPVRSTSGDRLFDLTYRFKFLKQGIQFLYYQGKTPNFTDAGYYEVTTTGVTNIGPGKFNNASGSGPVNIYPWSDFNALFRVPA